MSRSFQSRLLPADVVNRIRYYPRALEAALFVRARIDEAVRLDEIAGVAGMTPTAFSRYFATKIGITLAELIRTLRIERALERLDEGACAVTRLAEYAGYHSHSTFERAFKDVIGLSPAQYRRRLSAAQAS